MLGQKLKLVTSQYLSSLSLSDGVTSDVIHSYKVEEAGRYIISVKFSLRITVTAASAARGAIDIKINGTSNAIGGDGLENHWDSGGTTTGDIDNTTTKVTSCVLNAGDIITTSATIVKRGGTITAYNLNNSYFNVFKVE